MSDSLLRAWHRRGLKRSYTHFAHNTDRLNNLKSKVFLQAKRILLRFLQYYPSKTIEQEELNSIGKKKEPEFSDLKKLINEIRKITLILQAHNRDEKIAKDLKYVCEEMINLQDFYKKLSEADTYKDLEQTLLPYVGVSLTNQMEESLLRLSSQPSLGRLYQHLITKQDRPQLESLSSASALQQTSATEIPANDREDPSTTELALTEEAPSEMPENDQTQEPEAQARKIDAVELLEQNFDGIPKFLGSVHRLSSEAVNASMVIQPQIEHALRFSEAKVTELTNSYVLDKDSIRIELPIKNDQYKDSATIFLPVPAGYQISHLSQKDGNGNPATAPLPVSRNALGMVQLDNNSRSDVTKIHYLLQRQAVELDAQTRRELTLAIADPIDLEMHDSLIKNIPKIQEKIPFIANKVFSSVMFEESLSEREIAQLNLLICNEFRRAGIASYISTNGTFTLDPDGVDRIMVEPYSYSIVYFDEQGEVHEFIATQSYTAFAKQGSQSSSDSDAEFSPEAMPNLSERLTASISQAAHPGASRLIKPQPRANANKIICEHSLLKPSDFKDNQEFLQYYALELEQNQAQWQRHIQESNAEAIVKHLAELARLDKTHEGLWHNHRATSIVDFVNAVATPQEIKKVINQAYLVDKEVTKEDLITRLEADPRLRKTIRDFVFKSLDTFFDAEQYRDVDNEKMYVNHLFEGFLHGDGNKELFAAILRAEDLRDLSLDELEQFVNHMMFSFHNSTYENVKIQTLATVYKALLNKKAQIPLGDNSPNEQMNELFLRTSALLAELCSFSVGIKDDYDGSDPILDNGDNCTPSLLPSESYSLMKDLAQHNPEQLETIITQSIFSGYFAAFMNTKEHNEKLRLCDLIIRNNPAPNIFRIEEGKIILQDTFKLKLRAIMQEKIHRCQYNIGIVKELTNLYKFGVDTKGIISDDEFGKFLKEGGFGRKDIQMSELFDLDIEPEALDLSCPERAIKFKPTEDDVYRFNLYTQLVCHAWPITNQVRVLVST